MSLGLLYPTVDWTYQLQSLGVSPDISGAPAIVTDPSGKVYFALSARGTVGSLASISGYQIVVGCVSASGILQWLFRDPALVSSGVASNPGLAIGSSGELYLVFVTTGAVPGKVNGLSAPSFCGPCGSLQGPEDLVLARINGAVAGAPSVAWVIQDLSLNSCSRERRPRIMFDVWGNRVLLAYTTTGSVICALRIGTPNVVVSCFSPTTGGLVWAYQAATLNSVGQNDEPSLTVDPTGAVYVAYTVTALVPGGSFVGSASQPCVEVIKFTATGSPLEITRNWILSATGQINATAAINSSPSLAYDPSKNRLFLAFLTTGTIPGGTATSDVANNVVVASIEPLLGTIRWGVESPEYNEAGYRYSSLSDLVLTVDSLGTPYLAARGVQDPSGLGMIFMYRVNPETGRWGWLYYDGYTGYRAYLPAIQSTTTPNTAFRVGANYSGPWLTIRDGRLFVAFVNQDTETFQLVALRQVQRYQDVSAFEYMRDYTGICC